MNIEKSVPNYAPLVIACKSFGIGRTVAFELAKKNLVKHFTIGSKRYVYIESLNNLPERLAAQGGKK